MASVDVAGAQSNTQALPKGAFVKLDMGDEQFWVIVEKVLGQGRYVGSVDSECNMEDGACVSIGDRLQFTHQDVLKAYNNGQEM